MIHSFFPGTDIFYGGFISKWGNAGGAAAGNGTGGGREAVARKKRTRRTTAQKDRPRQPATKIPEKTGNFLITVKYI